MKVAIDIDNTLLRCKSLIYKLMSKLETAGKLKLKAKPVTFTNGEIREFTGKHRNHLFGKLGNIDMYEEIEGAVDTINKLAENGNQIVFLSNRPNIRFLNEIILTWLERNQVKYDFVVINCGNKVEFCKKHKVDLLIDDSLRNCMDADKEGIATILFGQGNKENKHYKIIDDSKIDYNTDKSKGEIILTEKYLSSVEGYNLEDLKGKVKKTNKRHKAYRALTWKDVNNVLDKEFDVTVEKEKVG